MPLASMIDHKIGSSTPVGLDAPTTVHPLLI